MFYILTCQENTNFLNEKLSLRTVVDKSRGSYRTVTLPVRFSGVREQMLDGCVVSVLSIKADRSILLLW